jgi:CBS domain-containing protein
MGRPAGKPVAMPGLAVLASSARRWIVQGRGATTGGAIVKVSDVLAYKGAAVVTIKPAETIEALSQLLRGNRIGAVVVSSDGATIEGVISERDLAYGIATYKGDLYATPVSALMTKAVITCAPTDDIAFVGSMMMSRKIRHLPVVKDNRLVGMVSIRDVLNQRVDELQQHTAQLRSFVNEANRPLQDRE